MLVKRSSYQGSCPADQVNVHVEIRSYDFMFRQLTYLSEKLIKEIEMDDDDDEIDASPLVDSVVNEIGLGLFRKKHENRDNIDN